MKNPQNTMPRWPANPAALNQKICQKVATDIRRSFMDNRLHEQTTSQTEKKRTN
jgi:hypothetical protein